VRTYYRDDLVWVTSTAINVGGRVYPLAELSYVWYRRGRPSIAVWVRRLVRVILLIATAVVVLRLPSLLLGGVVQYVLLILLVIVAGPLFFGVFPVWGLPLLPALDRSYLRGMGVHEIWTRWRGQELLLVRVDDVTRFGKIYRAIERAIEQADEQRRRFL